MLAVLLSVIGISLSGVMTPGPMFAVTVAKSYRSPWAGAKIALGHAIIEVPLVLLIFLSFDRLQTFFQQTPVQVALSAAGGGMLVWMGISMFRARHEVVHTGKDLRYGAVTAGIVLSATNPFFLLWWATVGGALVMKISPYGLGALPLFIGTHWLCDLIWLTIVSFAIFRTKTIWGNKFQMGVIVACAVLMLGFGAWFIYSGAKLLFVTPATASLLP